MERIADEQIVICERCGSDVVTAYWDDELETYNYIVPKNSFTLLTCHRCSCKVLVNRMRKGKYSYYKFYRHVEYAR